MIHLYYLAGRTPPPQHHRNTHVSPGLLHVLDHLTTARRSWCRTSGRCWSRTAVAVALQGAIRPSFTGLDRYMVWRWFSGTMDRDRFPEEDWPIHATIDVADLRATAARRAGDPDVRS